MTDHPLAGPFFTGDPKRAERCRKCMRNEHQMKMIAVGVNECSLLECPHRPRISATPGDRAPEVE